MDINPFRRKNAPGTPLPGSNGTPDIDNPNDSEPLPWTQRTWVWLVAGMALVAVVLGIWAIIKTNSDNAAKEVEAARQAQAQAELALQQQALEHEYDDLNRQFDQFESQRTQIANDSLKLALEEKYNTAKMQVERLQRQLRDTKNMNAQEIAKLKAEIETLRGLLRHYVEEIDRLNKENAALREENSQLNQQNQSLQSQVSSTTAQNEQLSRDMARASKLNVSAVSLTPLNKKGKTEKKVQKAQQLMVNFTVVKNVSAATGEKVFYVRITDPMGNVLGAAGSFPYEGGHVAYTAKRTVEYGGDDVPVTIYFDSASSTLSPGDYTVEIFTEGYRVHNGRYNKQ